MSKRIMDWLANGHTGISSKAMAFTTMGVTLTKDRSCPHDPSDLNRCLLLVEACPEVKDAFLQIRALSKEWAAIIDHWDELEKLFTEEVGPNWSRSKSAPKTYDRMKQLIDR